MDNRFFLILFCVKILVRIYLLFAVFVLVSVNIALSQTTVAPDDNDLQSWNDVQLTAKINKKVDLYSLATVQFDKNLKRVKDGRFAIGLTLKPLHSLSITPFVQLLRARNSTGDFKTEYRFTLRAVYRFPVENFGLSHRSQVEYRFRPGQNTWRYRPSVTFEKELPKKFVPGVKVFVTEEPFYDSGSGRFSRNRFSVGINKTLTEKLSLDIYYLRQDDNFSHPASINVIGTSWKIKL